MSGGAKGSAARGDAQGSGEGEANAAVSLIGFALVFGLAYAVIRYHVAGSVPIKDFPLFILNKALSLAAFVLLTFNFAFGPLANLGAPLPARWLDARKAIGMTAFLLVLVHALVSFLLFSPAVYAKFFTPEGTVTLLAGWSMLAGVLGFVFLWAYNLSFQTFLREDERFIRALTSRRVLLVALILGGVHVFLMGFEGWLAPSSWHGGMPPISLVAFVFFLVGYGANLLGRK